MGIAKNAAIAAEGRGYRWTDQALCPAHTYDSVLNAVITANLSETSCSYCLATGGDGETPVAAPLDTFLEAFMAGVYLLYEPAEDSGVPVAEGEWITTVYDSDEVVRTVMDHATAGRGDNDALTADITAALTTSDWVDKDWQRLSPDRVMHYSWESFKTLVKHSTRFFFGSMVSSPDDETLPASGFFAELARLIAEIPEIYPSPCPVLYRGRMTATEPDIAEYASATALGPPPPERAAANRMSPAGISMFYGSTDLDTAVAEIGAHSSYGHAVTGEFTPAREIRLIDLTKLPRLPSIFAPRCAGRYYAILFLRKFINDLTLPIDLDGREHIDYVPTQVFTEYLRYSFPARVDGLMFGSSQGSGANVVVFYGPEFCSDKGSEHESTRLSLDPASVSKHRVTTVIRRPTQP
ncbi:HEPN-associated N-terminal domain-containing protein [Aldersonia sp. NBC_00410]|uniref:HEPN-associated N-terminal domain-containing protein n=1 Tax=Aldersonia sp. NBC_00410 TaxID=2975954 RepID=UPI0022576287|nr:HEPN-associated N-terminal domain-containing protein [Aldersonia sp. NBC_00410]MCX5046272.1 HEPN-associated N-terminal domain-containing protein [Aldersonia sp. NBC_00410]